MSLSPEQRAQVTALKKSEGHLVATYNARMEILSDLKKEAEFDPWMFEVDHLRCIVRYCQEIQWHC